MPVVASLIGLNYAPVTGYVGSTNRVLAAIRGEIDVIIQNFDSVKTYVDSEELLPLLDVTGTGAGFTIPVPALGGPSGLAAEVAIENDRPAEEALRKAAALSAIISAGRLVVAPTGLPPRLETCLQTQLMALLNSDEFMDAASQAGLAIDASDPDSARSDLKVARSSLAEFTRLVQMQIGQARQ